MAFELGKKSKGNDPLSKVTAELGAKNAEIEAAYCALGKAYFAAHEKDAEDGLKAHIDAIASSKKRVDLLNELSVRLQGIKLCPNCKAQITSDSAFCNLCGTKIPEPAPLFDDENVYCNVCASPMPLGQKFCSFCGATLPAVGGKAEAPAAPASAPEAPVVEAPAAPVFEEPEVPEAPVIEVPEVPEEPVVEAPEAPEIPEAPEAPVFEAPEVPEEPAAPEAPVFEAPAAPAPEAPATQNCPACGKVLPLGVRFCTGCGRDLSAPAPAQNVCPNCGKVLSPGAIFCTGCGLRVK